MLYSFMHYTTNDHIIALLLEEKNVFMSSYSTDNDWPKKKYSTDNVLLLINAI